MKGHLCGGGKRRSTISCLLSFGCRGRTDSHIQYTPLSAVGVGRGADISLTGFYPLWDKIHPLNPRAVADQGCHLEGSSPYKGTAYRGMYCRWPNSAAPLLPVVFWLPVRVLLTASGTYIPWISVLIREDLKGRIPEVALSCEMSHPATYLRHLLLKNGAENFPRSPKNWEPGNKSGRKANFLGDLAFPLKTSHCET
jgi:hypothetical protein